MFGDPLQSFPLTLLSGALAFVGAALPVVRRPFALVGDSVSLVGHSFTLVSDLLATQELVFAPCQRIVVLVMVAGHHGLIKRFGAAVGEGAVAGADSASNLRTTT